MSIQFNPIPQNYRKNSVTFNGNLGEKLAKIALVPSCYRCETHVMESGTKVNMKGMGKALLFTADLITDFIRYPIGASMQLLGSLKGETNFLGKLGKKWNIQ